MIFRERNTDINLEKDINKQTNNKWKNTTLMKTEIKHAKNGEINESPLVTENDIDRKTKSILDAP